MALAVLADVHANLVALDAVLADAEAKGVDGWYCLGDVVGYGPDPLQCVRRLRERGTRCLTGNHEAAVIGLPTGPFNEFASQAVEYTRRVLEPDELEWIRALPPDLQLGEDVLMVHGSVVDRDAYLFSDEDFLAALRGSPAWLTFFGHTHQQMVFESEGEIGWECKIRLDRGRRYLINPGSVGQPRDGDPRAGWAYLDLEAQVLELRRVDYDVEAAVRRYVEADLPPRLAARLRVGR